MKLHFGQLVSHNLFPDKTYLVLRVSDRHNNGVEVVTQEGELAVLHMSHVAVKQEDVLISASQIVEVIKAAKDLQGSAIAFFGPAAKHYMSHQINALNSTLSDLISSPPSREQHEQVRAQSKSF